jgi:hypothetical protein
MNSRLKCFCQVSGLGELECKFWPEVGQEQTSRPTFASPRFPMAVTGVCEGDGRHHGRGMCTLIMQANKNFERKHCTNVEEVHGDFTGVPNAVYSW